MLSLRPHRHYRHLLGGVKWSDIVSTAEFVHIPPQVLHRDVVVCPVKPTLHQGPEGLYAVGASLPLHVLPGGMLDGPVGAVRHPLVGFGLVGIDHGADVSGLQDEPL